jgi:Spy/CpxP family protein refolding chaperone
MRGFLKWTLVLGLVLGMASAAQAQGPGGRVFGGPGTLLMNSSVQKELKLTDDQVTKAKEALEKVRDNHKDDLAKLRDLSAEERQKLLRTVGEETQKAVAGILDDKQMKRLKQIQWQTNGANALNDPEVQKALKMNDEQKQKLKDIFEASNKKMRELLQGGNAEGAREKFQEIRKETQEKADGVLTADQKKNWKEMKGEPFEIQRQRRQQ